jgi:hypothetical protein
MQALTGNGGKIAAKGICRAANRLRESVIPRIDPRLPRDSPETSTEGLDNATNRSKIPPNSGEILLTVRTGNPTPGFMTPTPPSQFPEKAKCKHPRVQIVAREEDEEFVECLECGEIFESSEFKDMAIEDTKLSNESTS